MYPEAAKAAVRVTDPTLTNHVSNLLAVLAFEQDNLPGCRRQLEQCAAGCEVEVAVNTGCVLYKEGDFEGAAAKFKEAADLDSSNLLLSTAPVS
jgi:tetratricopeptide repeat protein 30